MTPDHALFDCTNDENITECTLDCEDGYDFDHVIRNKFECGKDTNYQWNFMSGGYQLSDLPSCQGITVILINTLQIICYQF